MDSQNENCFTPKQPFELQHEDFPLLQVSKVYFTYMVSLNCLYLKNAHLCVIGDAMKHNIFFKVLDRSVYKF